MVKDTFESVSRKIREKTSYTGGGEGIAESNGYMVIWSNNRGDWTTSRGFRKGDRLYLDADRVPVYATRGEIESWISKLPVLPLYQHSFEVWSEGRDPTKKGREPASSGRYPAKEREPSKRKQWWEFGEFDCLQCGSKNSLKPFKSKSLEEFESLMAFESRPNSFYKCSNCGAVDTSLGMKIRKDAKERRNCNCERR
jgi:hypothetical protein